MNNNARYDRSTSFLELEVNVPRTIGILRDGVLSSKIVLIITWFFLWEHWAISSTCANGFNFYFDIGSCSEFFTSSFAT